ncbi:acyl carrier protein [Sphingobium yanoikuyae]|uniref:acyl carrier protein n=1 Tax=Sphingobium yanoikuyae TaxID=13690 RepID=UPI0022DE8596|nr:phosphopantetheine-binding protein [Sphingobium yanoikuyae]WBQ19378.1 phosphopantetheine-binding protein [Sphingobium yanoikuyae]
MSISPDAIIDIFETETGLPRDKFRPDATLAELDIASLDLVSIAFEVEDKLGVEIKTDDLKADMTVGALIEQIQLLRSA